MQQMLRAKCHWGLHIGMLKPTLSIRAFGDPLVRARKAGVQMSFYHGLGMFILGMFAIIVGGMIAWYIINKVMEEDEDKK